MHSLSLSLRLDPWYLITLGPRLGCAEPTQANSDKCYTLTYNILYALS